jgi:signal transduction histidine kinase
METAIHAVQKKDAGVEELIHDDFMDLAVHDLDAPLRKLILLTDRLGEKCNEMTLPDELQPYLSRISNCANDMRTLIDDLHQLTNIRLQNLNYELCNLEEVVQEALHEIQENVNEKKAIIEVANLPLLQGDRKLLTILFKNLVLNSIKFSQKESIPKIMIDAAIINANEKNILQLTPDRMYHKIVITDNGIGFKEEEARKIFRPFVSLQGKLTAGNGMGLAICKKIALLHGGLLYAEGREGEGAIFTFIVPQTL